MTETLKKYLQEISTADYDVSDRSNLSIQIIKSGEIHNQSEFIEAYKFITAEKIQQSTVSDLFKANSITKIDGVYQTLDSLSEEELAKRYFICTYCTNIYKTYSFAPTANTDKSEQLQGKAKNNYSDLFYFKISVIPGNEHSIAKFIYEQSYEPKLKTSPLTIIPGFGSILIMSHNKTRLKKHKKILRNYIHYTPTLEQD